MGATRNISTSLLGVCLLLIGGCGREAPLPTIRLPATHVLSTGSSWAVITENLLRVREKPSKVSEVIMHVRKSTVVEVISRTENREVVENEEDYWYLVDYSGLKGWVFGAYMKVASTRAEAEELAKTLP